MPIDSAAAPGTLWVVATPIGHLGDLGDRARAILSAVPVIAAEDTRVSARLLADRASPVRMISLNEHSERRHLEQVLDCLSAGEDVALVSDAGTPLISDPGFRLVQAAHERGVRVSPVPGPCAAVAALSVAGLASDRFWFEGFLPARSAARRRRLAELASLPITVITYVPARDLAALLEDCAAALGPARPAALARELTKLHETVRQGSVADLLAFCRSDPNQARGEAVLVLAGSEQAAVDISIHALADELARALPPSQAARVLARVSGLSRKQAWQLLEGRTAGSAAGTTVTGDD